MKVVIIGGGFSGIQTALNLSNKPLFEVRLISDKSYFEYHAALYRTATGRSALEVAIPLARLFASAKNVEVVQDSVTTVSPNDHSVTGESGSIYHFDVLIFGVGNVNDYFHISGLQEFSYGVKTIQEALALKRHLHESTLEGQIGEKNYVIIGGGATGVELAGELRAYAESVRQKHKAQSVNFNVALIEAAPRILPAMPEPFAEKVAQRLNQLKVTIHTGTKVEKETANELILPGGKIESRTVIWTAGSANHPLFTKQPQLFPTDKRGKVIVNDYLETVPGIYVLGDSASTTYSGMAQTALYDAHFVTHNLMAQAQGRIRQAYVPKRPSYAIPVGPRWSAVIWKNYNLYGYFGWVLRRLIDLHLYLVFLPLRKALFTWRYGFTSEEVCAICRK